MGVRIASSKSAGAKVDGVMVGAKEGFENKYHSKFRDVSTRVRFHSSSAFDMSPSALVDATLFATFTVILMKFESSVSENWPPIFLM